MSTFKQLQSLWCEDSLVLVLVFPTTHTHLVYYFLINLDTVSKQLFAKPQQNTSSLAGF